ncbi:hypothetical protein ANN_11280 [Periplaneta americana]|uniref:Uncharacterized protein n=1 Tax=Periplaneta americana TaxID=6978 RepID=A0ABQ8T6B0_PERAM|nr:hypothetical protein ANN_11280 [Periplaneta americana]
MRLQHTSSDIRPDQLRTVPDSLEQNGAVRAGIVLSRLSPNTFVLRCPHRKKSHTVKSGDLGGQAISPFREMTRPEKKAFTASSEILATKQIPGGGGGGGRGSDDDDDDDDDDDKFVLVISHQSHFLHTKISRVATGNGIQFRGCPQLTLHRSKSKIQARKADDNDDDESIIIMEK